MKVFVTGGTGFVGGFLCQALAQAGYEVTILTRRPAPMEGFAYLTGDPTREGPWMEEVTRHDWVINLAGASIFAHWTEEKKKVIRESRILTTRNLVKAMAAGDRLPLFCSTSAPGYFGDRGEEILTEESPPADGFLAEVAQEWEWEALKARELGARVVITRFGLVLGRGGGLLGTLEPAFKAFVGGPAGDGRQWMPWIHHEDLCRAFLFLPAHPELSGPVHFCAPNPVRNWDFAKALGRALGRPSFLTAPAFMLRLVLGELSQAVLSSQRMVPDKLLQAGFEFRYPTLEQALAAIYGPRD
ncbi:MAG: TIGR01777 family oxidoreductase [Syntrophobacterales bacterium]|nr:TIGR01777 family oxidoreductase [Syntrophobacterales bacterium]